VIVCPNNLKIQIKFEIYDICQYIMISCVKVIVKIGMSFEHFEIMMLRNRNISDEVS
jgi:hypothetical protein